MYIYVEDLIVVILENMAINYIILYATKRYTRTDTKTIRLVLAAFIGALYTLVIFFPTLNFMTKFLVKLSISILIITIAFNPITFSKFIRIFATFYVITFVFAGAALALIYVSGVETIVGGGIFHIIKLLLTAVIISWILFKVAWEYIQTRINRERMFIPITINLNNEKVDVTALMDTGNYLKDPITQIPVIVVQFSAIKDLLPANIQNIFTKYKEDNLVAISEIMSDTTNFIKFRLIPFKSLGKENGMLLGFKPDKVIVKNDEEKQIHDIVVGIYNNKLSNNNEYMALLHPEILK